MKEGITNPAITSFGYHWIYFTIFNIIFLLKKKKFRPEGPCRPEGLVRLHHLDRPRAGSGLKDLGSSILLSVNLAISFDWHDSGSVVALLGFKMQIYAKVNRSQFSRGGHKSLSRVIIYILLVYITFVQGEK